jgi:mannosyl-3-phosphoglycerate phosphatase
MPAVLVFTDLDGTLLDGAYSYEPASPALLALERGGIPLVLVSSKTKAEIEPLRTRMKHDGPFVVENGGALLIPQGWPDHRLGDGYQVIAFGTPYPVIRAALKHIGQALGVTLTGFGDMSVEEIAHLSGLSPDGASLARTREYDEPFFVADGHVTLAALQEAAAAHGLTCTRGGGFYHLLGTTDKGKACRHLIEFYRRHVQPEAVKTIGLGDSLNDLPMLAEVDIPVLVQRPDGSYAPDIRVPALRRAGGIGPVGWNTAVLELLNLGSS